MYQSRGLYLAQIVIQIALLVVFWWAGSLLQRWLNLPISAGVVGLFLVLLGLLSGLFKLEWIKTGSDFILGELVLFFIPCLVGLINYKTLFITEGWQLVSAVVLGTICVMVFTAYSVHVCFKLEAWFKRHYKLGQQQQSGAKS